MRPWGVRWKGCDTCRTESTWHRWWCPVLRCKMLIAAMVFPLWLIIGLGLPAWVGLGAGGAWLALWVLAGSQSKKRGER